MDQTSLKLSKACKVLGLIVLGLTFFKIFNTAILNKDILLLLNRGDLRTMLDLQEFYKNMALSFLLLFLSKLIEGSFNEFYDKAKERFLNLTLFFLTLMSLVQISKSMASGLHSLRVIKTDQSFLLQIIFFQIIDFAYCCIPIVFAVILYKIHQNYSRLEEFEKEVI